MNPISWAKILIAGLWDRGVRHLCIAPGARSAPLIVAGASHPSIHNHVHFDERGLGFLALGIAKSARQPVGVIVTSGTAVGNLFPAVMEASHDSVPLVLLTADRPPELRHCGANQTTDQVKLFGDFVRFHVDLPCPFPNAQSYLTSTIGYALHKALHDGGGPVHINCMFREPFFSSAECATTTPRSTAYSVAHGALDPDTAHFWAETCSAEEEGIIVCGQGAPTEAADLAHALSWPLFAEITSPLRHTTLPYYEILIRSGMCPQPKIVLHLGGRLVSKYLMDWMVTSQPAIYCHVSDLTKRFDPHHAVTHHVFAPVGAFCNAVRLSIQKTAATRWQMQWTATSNIAQSSVENTLECTSSTVSEPAIAHMLRNITTTQCALFFSNSMPIRDAEAFFFPQLPLPIHANRGVSGIDGNIGTAAGIAHGLRLPTIAVLGDLAALHDLNSLALIAQSPHPLLLLILNNGGGGIFSFFPMLVEREYFATYFRAAHTTQFHNAAALFHLPYSLLKSVNDLATALHHFVQQPRSQIIEVPTHPEENVALHHTIVKAVASDLRNVYSSP